MTPMQNAELSPMDPDQLEKQVDSYSAKKSANGISMGSTYAGKARGLLKELRTKGFDHVQFSTVDSLQITLVWQDDHWVNVDERGQVMPSGPVVKDPLVAPSEIVNQMVKSQRVIEPTRNRPALPAARIAGICLVFCVCVFLLLAWHSSDSSDPRVLPAILTSTKVDDDSNSKGSGKSSKTASGSGSKILDEASLKRISLERDAAVAASIAADIMLNVPGAAVVELGSSKGRFVLMLTSNLRPDPEGVVTRYITVHEYPKGSKGGKQLDDSIQAWKQILNERTRSKGQSLERQMRANGELMLRNGFGDPDVNAAVLSFVNTEHKGVELTGQEYDILQANSIAFKQMLMVRGSRITTIEHDDGRVELMFISELMPIPCFLTVTYKSLEDEGFFRALTIWKGMNDDDEFGVRRGSRRVMEDLVKKGAWPFRDKILATDPTSVNPLIR